MAYFVGIDASLETVNICIVDEEGTVALESTIEAEPSSIIEHLERFGKPVLRVGPALDNLETFSEGAAHLVGHNILRHDLPRLIANRARLAALGAASVDTLWLNPLAFPRNPYHHLVKHYQDRRLQVGHVNDPEQDARLALQVLTDQLAAFARLGQDAPDTLMVYHHLTTWGEAAAGFDALFVSLRGAAPERPVHMSGRPCPAAVRRNYSDPSRGKNITGTRKYRALRATCQACPSKDLCCPNADARYVTRTADEDARDFARDCRKTKAYKVSRDKRKKVEMLFAHLKRILTLTRLRLRGPNGARDEFTLAAIAQNLRKLVKLRPAFSPMKVAT